MTQNTNINITIPDLEDVPEINPVAEGEYDLRITGVRNGMTKGDQANGKLPRPSINLTLEVIGDPTADIIFKSFYMPLESDTERAKTKMLSDLRKWAKACDLPTNGLDPQDFMNCEVSAYLIVTEWNGQERNEVKTLI